MGIPLPWRSWGALSTDQLPVELGGKNPSPSSSLLIASVHVLSQVVMTIIVAFILDAFVFRMNYTRKNQDSEGQNRALVDLNVVSSLPGDLCL